jgi:DNA-binding MarR family transcriptional regulator
MPRDHERNLEILTAIGEGEHLTQRALAQRLGVALGLANLYLKRLASTGYIKITDFPRKPSTRKRLRYLLTPKGIAEKTRLTYEYMGRSLRLYRSARETLREALSHLPQNGMKRIALYGAGEAAELAYLTLKEFGIEPIAVFDRKPGGVFLGYAVRDEKGLLEEEVDGVIVSTFEPPDAAIAHLRELRLSPEKLLLLRPPKGTNGPR